jgi:hypothetical protein
MLLRLCLLLIGRRKNKTKREMSGGLYSQG